jgi:hypothetical protein
LAKIPTNKGEWLVYPGSKITTNRYILGTKLLQCT